jgi:anti-sigma factor RsiW
MNCRSAEPLFSSYIEDEISQEERRNLEAHFMGCRRCSVALRDLRATMILVQREVPLVSTSAHFEEDLYAKIRSGEGLRPSAWELVRELLLPIRLRPVVMAGVGVSAVAVALTFSPVGQSLLRPAAPPMTASKAPSPRADIATQPVTPVVAERNVAPDLTPAPRVRQSSVVASAGSTAPAARDSIVDGPAPLQRYNDEIINDQFYLDRGAPGQDPNVQPVNTSQDDGVYIIF